MTGRTGNKQGLVFVGRRDELLQFEQLKEDAGAKILVVYGRRRVGKTTLIHKAFSDRRLLKFEGIEGRPPRIQRENFLQEMSRHFNDPSLAKLRVDSWRDVFIELAKRVSRGNVTLYFEEVQWLSSYKDDLIVDLKYAWDNYLKQNDRLILILCGSAPSFLIDKVVMSKALYNRSNYTFPIGELTIKDVRDLMGPSISKENALDAYLSVGGIPEYVKYLTSESSVYLSLCRHAFLPGGFFVDEADRVFVSSLANNPHYKAIVGYLARHGARSKSEVIKDLRIPLGGAATRVFGDLKQSGFIDSFASLKHGHPGRNARYFLADNYLNFYYSFIHSQVRDISSRRFARNPNAAMPIQSYRQWLGYSFERYCLTRAHQLAATMGFAAVRYDYGPMYKPDGAKAQIDLAFRRADKVLTICEIKYQADPVGMDIAHEFERKVGLIASNRRESIQRVLIAPGGVTPNVRSGGYFDVILGLDDIFS